MALRHAAERPLAPRPASPRGTHAMWVITLVRRPGGRPRAADAARSVASARSIVGDPDVVARSTARDRAARSMAPPGSAVAVQEVVRARRPPGARRRSSGTAAGRAARPATIASTSAHCSSTSSARVKSVASPSIASRISRSYASGMPVAERAAVEEVHVHGPDRHALPGHLRADRERDALVRLHVDEQHVRAAALPTTPPRTAGAARA